jgi:TIR domain
LAGKIFISYRRAESKYPARMIYESFARVLPPDSILMDVDDIPPGADFVKVLEGWVEQCEVMLVLMGERWANFTDPKTGKRRLDNPKDFVRIEIRGALNRNIPVVPVLLDGAELPDEAELPDDIKGLLNRQAQYVDLRNFGTDVQRLINKLGMGSTAKRTTSSATEVATPRPEAEADLADKAREKKTGGIKGWLTRVAAATALLAVAVIGIWVYLQAPRPFDSPLSPVPRVESTRPPTTGGLNGWVAIGYLQSNNASFVWANGKPITSQPTRNDLIKAKTSVNVRSDAAAWKDPLGVLQPGDCFRIDSTRVLDAAGQPQTWAGGKQETCP